MSPEQLTDSSHDPAWIVEFIHHLPIGTTVISAAFFAVLLRRYLLIGRGAHLLWWAGGVFAYGVGTALEASITLGGNSIALNKAWYVAGAIFGGYPLAQGTVFLLLRRRTAVILTAVSLPAAIGAAALVLASPVVLDAMEPHRPTGAILEWSWVRLLTPFINLYAVVFLIGGAILSAIRYARRSDAGSRVIGNILIALGATLPGIGGALTKADLVEALYLGEFFGIILIWVGYAYCVRVPREAAAPKGVPPAERSFAVPGQR